MVNETIDGMLTPVRGTRYVQEQLDFCLAAPWPGYTAEQCGRALKLSRRSFSHPSVHR